MRSSLRGRLPASLAGVRPGRDPRCFRRRRPSTAADPVDPAGRDVQRPRFAQPVPDRSCYVGYEIFTLNYDLLVDFGPNNEPVPGLRRVVDPVDRRPVPGRSRSAPG